MEFLFFFEFNGRHLFRFVAFQQKVKFPLEFPFSENTF